MESLMVVKIKVIDEPGMKFIDILIISQVDIFIFQ